MPFVCCVILSLFSSLPLLAKENPPLTILYNGSFIGQLSPLSGGVQSKSVAFIESQRKLDKELLLLASGDCLGPGPIGDIDGGKSMVEVMNIARYDAAGLGLYECFAGYESFKERALEAKFPFVSANVVAKEGKNPLVPFVIVERNGWRVFVTGVVSPRYPNSSFMWSKELAVRPILPALRALKDKARDCSLVIVLATQSMGENVELLKKLPWVHIVITSMVDEGSLADLDLCSTTLRDGRRLLWTFLGGKKIGALRVFSCEANSLESKIELHSVSESHHADERVKDVIEGLDLKTQKETGNVLARLSKEEANDFESTFLNVLRCSLNAEVALIDRSSLAKTTVDERLTYLALRQVYPYISKGACTVVSGRLLKELWSKRKNALIWGKGLVFTGLTEESGRVCINRRPIVNDDRYRVATTQYLAEGGGDLLPKDSNSVVGASLFDVVARFFESHGFVERKRRLARIERKAVLRQQLKADLYYDRMSFGGAAEAYQYDDPNRSEIGSDIPGLSGLPHDAVNLYIEAERTYTWQRSIGTIRLVGGFYEWDGKMWTDSADLTLRYEKNSLGRKPTWFTEFSLQGTVDNPEEQSRPLFLKGVAGLRWKPLRHAKFFAGLGHLSRQSQPEKPSDSGLNLAFEVKQPLQNDIVFSANLDFFTAATGEDVRTLDGRCELSFRLNKRLRSVARYRKFLWHDNVHSSSALRNEFYIGLGIRHELRRF